MLERNGALMTPEDAALYDKYTEEAAYYDRLQYVYKIKLNSLYGALSNCFFRFFDLRLGESTTGTGRLILQHQCRKVSEILDGKYEVDFPLYPTTEISIEKGHSAEVALNGPKFNGNYQSESVVYGDSVSGDTKIDTNFGKINIDQLFTKIDFNLGDREYCNVSNVLGLTYDKTTNETQYRPIKYIMRHKCSKQLYRVWITNSQWLDVTEDHSLIGYVNSNYRSKYNDIMVEVKPDNIASGDIKSLIYAKHKPQLIIESLNLSKTMYELMGLVIGDGYVDTTPSGGTLLSIGKDHISNIETSVFDQLKKEGWISSWVIKPNGHDVQISSVKLRKFLRQYLYVGNKKTIQNWLYLEHPDNIASFLRGWFSADGFINKNNTIGLCSVNEDHIKSAQDLLFKCGVSSTWFTERTENSYKGKKSGTFTKRLTVKSSSVFKQKIGFVIKAKQQQLDKFTEGRLKSVLSTYDFDIVSPIKIEKIHDYDDYVYDIEIDNTHVFFANNLLVHNTDSCYFKTHAENIEDAIKIADYVADKVNDSYKPFMQRAFLCQPNFNNLVKCGREIVSDRGIFVEKKRYILHLVDVEGKRVDKCKVMGLDTKKTTLPVEISKQLNNFIERFLKGESWEEVSKSIVNYKEYLRLDASLTEIGLPKGIKNVEEYTQKFENDYDTRLPGHVAASIHYNNMLKEHNDKTSLPIISGMKIKVFYLKQMYGRFKSIAIPTDADEIPNWFLENFEVDRHLHVEKLVDNPLQNILKAVNKRVPTAQLLILNEEWEF
ncbi:MAG: DNA polymerase domain-containing protein [Nitrososphaeraceae archaeon]